MSNRRDFLKISLSLPLVDYWPVKPVPYMRRTPRWGLWMRFMPARRSACRSILYLKNYIKATWPLIFGR